MGLSIYLYKDRNMEILVFIIASFLSYMFFGMHGFMILGIFVVGGLLSLFILIGIYSVIVGIVKTKFRYGKWWIK